MVEAVVSDGAKENASAFPPTPDISLPILLRADEVIE
jgi:hypothetical protein